MVWFGSVQNDILFLWFCLVLNFSHAFPKQRKMKQQQQRKNYEHNYFKLKQQHLLSKSFRICSLCVKNIGIIIGGIMYDYVD